MYHVKTTNNNTTIICLTCVSIYNTLILSNVKANARTERCTFPRDAIRESIVVDTLKVTCRQRTALDARENRPSRP
jgi:hypothetical protein